MTISMYAALVPPLLESLGNLRYLLEKAEQHASSHGYDSSVLLQSRLYPDMFDLTRQVQVATDIARRGAARLAQMEAPAVEDKETSIAELIARIDHTLAYLQQLPEAAFEGSEQRSVSLPLPAAIGGGEMLFEGWPYLSGFVLPNVYFHVTTSYALLRHNGVPLGKRDFLMGAKTPTT